MERAEQHPEGIPGNSLEDLFAAKFDDLAAQFELYEQDVESFSDHDVEQDRPTVRLFTDKLTELLLDGSPPEAAQVASYRMLHMVYASYAFASGSTTRLVMPAFIEALKDARDPVVLRAYADAHPITMQLVDVMRPIADPTNEYSGAVNTIALLACMVLERDMQDGAWKDADTFADKLDEWDGNLSGWNLDPTEELQAINADLLTNEQAIKDYMTSVNAQLALMELGADRDDFAAAAIKELNLAWSNLDLRDTVCTFKGLVCFSDLRDDTSEDGIATFSYFIKAGLGHVTGASRGFAYKAMEDEPPKILHRVYINTEEVEIHPTLVRDYHQYVFFDETCTFTVYEGEEAENEEGDTLSESNSMSEVELALFNEMEDPETAQQEIFHAGAADILSVCSQGLRRHMKRPSFYSMSHEAQKSLVEKYITIATESSQVVDMTAILEPQHAYVFRPLPGQPGERIATRLDFKDVPLIGKVQSIGTFVREIVELRPIRSAKDLTTTVPGLTIKVKLEDAHLLTDGTLLEPTEEVTVPISGQNFYGSFTFIPDSITEVA